MHTHTQVCLNVAPDINTGLWETPAYGHSEPLSADTFTEYLNKSANYTNFPYVRYVSERIDLL